MMLAAGGVQPKSNQWLNQPSQVSVHMSGRANGGFKLVMRLHGWKPGL